MNRGLKDRNKCVRSMAKGPKKSKRNDQSRSSSQGFEYNLEEFTWGIIYLSGDQQFQANTLKSPGGRNQGLIDLMGNRVLKYSQEQRTNALSVQFSTILSNRKNKKQRVFLFCLVKSSKLQCLIFASMLSNVKCKITIFVDVQVQKVLNIISTLNQQVHGQSVASNREDYVKGLVGKYGPFVTAEEDYFTGKPAKTPPAQPLGVGAASAAVHQPGNRTLPKTSAKVDKAVTDSETSLNVAVRKFLEGSAPNSKKSSSAKKRNCPKPKV